MARSLLLPQRGIAGLRSSTKTETLDAHPHTRSPDYERELLNVAAIVVGLH